MFPEIIAVGNVLAAKAIHNDLGLTYFDFGHQTSFVFNYILASSINSVLFVVIHFDFHVFAYIIYL